MQYPTVVCGSDDHRVIVILSVILLITFVAPFIGVQIWANFYTIKVRANSQDATLHTTRFRFMLYRYRPDVWWWGTIFTIRQTLLAFSPILEPGDPNAQSVFIIAVLTIYIAHASFFWPWKSDELNLLDTVSMVLLVILVAVASGSFNLKLMVAILTLIAICAGFLVVYCVLMVCSRGIVSLTGIFGFDERRLWAQPVTSSSRTSSSGSASVLTTVSLVSASVLTTVSLVSNFVYDKVVISASVLTTVSLVSNSVYEKVVGSASVH